MNAEGKPVLSFGFMSALYDLGEDAPSEARNLVPGSDTTFVVPLGEHARDSRGHLQVGVG